MHFSPEEIDRYARHLVLREIGGAGQQSLKAARVLVVGMGGLGAPAALYLAAAGVGRLGLVDADVVSLSNLQRQVLYRTDQIGAPKIEAARDQLRALNPHVVLDLHPEPFTEDNGARLVRDYDLVLDGTDSFAVRFAVNAACLAEGKPLVSGAIGRWTGQVGLYCTPQGPCYRCLTPQIPPDAETCQAVGVVGALAGMVGSAMALEAVKRLAGVKPDLEGRLLILDCLAWQSRTVRMPRDPACPACSAARG